MYPKSEKKKLPMKLRVLRKITRYTTSTKEYGEIVRKDVAEDILQQEVIDKDAYVALVKKGIHQNHPIPMKWVDIPIVEEIETVKL